jgi:hypothetical protein
VKVLGEGEMMIANFDKDTSIATSESGMWSARAQRHEVARSSLIERVCSFLEQYPFLHADDEDAARSVTPCRTRDDRGQR